MQEASSAIVDTSNYRAFFRDQEARVSSLDQRRIAVAVVVVIALVILLIFLQSPWLVWTWVAILLGVTYHGFWRLRTALQVTQAALKDLRELSGFLNDSPARAEIEKYVVEKVGPDDSNVPEALAALFTGHVSGERVRTAANSAFSQPASELSVAQFLRTALVLGGLFGTVLFFAVELGRPGLLTGDLTTLLPGLRGALASTLTGILGSIALGYVGSKIDQIVERSVWETESLIGGPFARSLAVIADVPELESETQLWHALVSEVAQLRRETQESYAKLGNDVTAHVAALQELSKQLQEIPPLQVPPQLASLSDAIAVFKAGTDQLQTTVGSLVGAVATVGISVPMQTIETLRAIRDESHAGRAQVQHSLVGMQQTVASVDHSLRQHAERTEGTLTEMRAVQAQQLSRTEAARQAAEGAQTIANNGLRHIADTVSALPDAVSRIDEVTSRTAERTIGISNLLEARLTANGERPASLAATKDGSNTPLDPTQKLAQLVATIEQVPKELKQTTQVLTDQIGSIREANAVLLERSDRVASSLDRVSTYQKSLVDLGPRLEAMQRWQDRVIRAPLMRLLMLSFRRSGTEQPSHGS
jgi:hypothetical protein